MSDNSDSMEAGSFLDRKRRGGKSFWEWMQVFIVPFAIALFTIVFSVVQSCSQQRIEEQRSQDEALQAYLGTMTDLLLNEELASSGPDSVESTLARSRTLSVLDRLDGDHKRTVVIFLSETNLIWRGEPGTQDSSVDELYPVVDLRLADLSGTNLNRLSLAQIDLSEANLAESALDADFQLANLTYSDLSHTDFSDNHVPGSAAVLRGANLTSSTLIGADLSNTDFSNRVVEQASVLNNANLTNANLRNADLTGADLSQWERTTENGVQAYRPGANLTSADLTGADLTGADLTGADLTDATVTDEQLATVKSLEGATMPDGSKHP